MSAQEFQAIDSSRLIVPEAQSVPPSSIPWALGVSQMRWECHFPSLPALPSWQSADLGGSKSSSFLGRGGNVCLVSSCISCKSLGGGGGGFKILFLGFSACVYLFRKIIGIDNTLHSFSLLRSKLGCSVFSGGYRVLIPWKNIHKGSRAHLGWFHSNSVFPVVGILRVFLMIINIRVKMYWLLSKESLDCCAGFRSARMRYME